MQFQNEVQKIEEATSKIRELVARLPKPKIVRNIFWGFLGGTILVTLFLVFVANVFFSFYFSVPETSRFVKTMASQTALLSHAEMQNQLEKINAIRLAQFHPQAGLIALNLNTKVGTSSELKVQSSLLGVATNSIVGTWKTTPYEKTRAYQLGMKTSYQSGKEYYSGSFLISAKGYQQGMLASLSGFSVVDDNLFARSLDLIRKADSALALDVHGFLNQSNDRSTRLSNYVSVIEEIKTEMQIKQVLVQNKISFLKEAESQTRDERKNSEDNFFNSLRSFDHQNAQNELGQFIENSQANVDKKAHYQAMSQVDRYFNQYLPALVLRQKALEENREALVHGVKVVVYRDVNLGLVTAGQ